MLKGWCSGIGRVDKVMHSDFIHSAQGHPVYFETTDNFLDLRERVFAFIQHFRTGIKFEPGKALTFVIDRGIFGAATFAEFAVQEHLHLITWEKDYRKDGWDQNQPAHGDFIYERARNNSEDLFSYHFSYQEHSWDKNPALKRIIVRATNPKNKQIEVAVLSDDLERSSQEIILLIFRRWVQENDFKYLDKHFGIDQITSYQAVSYQELADKITDKDMLNTVYANLTKQRQTETSKLKNLLFKREQAQRRETQREKTITGLENGLEQSKDELAKKEIKKQLSTQRGQQKRARGNLERWKHEIEHQHQKIEEISLQLKATSKDQSRLEKLIEDNAQKMKGNRKRLMDALKILARNLFYILLKPFKTSYNNYRDDHVIFRSLTNCGGLIEADQKQVWCHLILEPDYPRAIRKLLNEYLQNWNAEPHQFPDGSGRLVTLNLISSEGVKVVPLNPSIPPDH